MYINAEEMNMKDFVVKAQKEISNLVYGEKAGKVYTVLLVKDNELGEMQLFIFNEKGETKRLNSYKNNRNCEVTVYNISGTGQVIGGLYEQDIQEIYYTRTAKKKFNRDNYDNEFDAPAYSNHLNNDLIKLYLQRATIFFKTEEEN